MGLYDCRCMITGVSLKGADAALVLLQPTAGRHAPIALAIKGTYNRLGSIDGIDEDANSRLVLRYFLDRLRTGAFKVNEQYLAGNQCFPIRTIGDLLQGFERNMNDDPNSAVLHGQPVVFALIARAVWDAIAGAADLQAEPMAAVFERLFGVSSVGAEVYAGLLTEVTGHVAELAAVDRFLTGRGLVWRPSEAGGQDFSEEMLQYLSEARQSFSDSPTITAALDRYEEEVGDLLQDE